MPEPLTDLVDIRRFSNALRLQCEQRMTSLTLQLIDGQINLATWQEVMRAELRRANYLQFVTGKGGDRTRIESQEYLKLGPELRHQYAHLNRFAKDIKAAADEGKSIQFALERSKLYARSTQAMMWRAAIPVKLPQVPRDGKTACLTNCKCYLDYAYERNEEGAITAVLVWWKLTPAEHCDDCIALSQEWNPKPFPTGTKESAPFEQAVNLLILAEGLYEDAPELRAMWGLQVGG